MAYSGRPVTPQDLFAFRPVSDCQISPDGKWIAHVLDTVDLEKQKSRGRIWLVPAAGGEPRALTNPGAGSDRNPRWSPDSSRLAFISDRSGKAQVCMIDVAGGEAQTLESEQRPTSAPVWSPDGRQIAFAASVFDKADDWAPYPGAPEGDRERATQYAAGPKPAGEKKEGVKEPSQVKVISRFKFRMDGVGYYGDKRTHLFVIPADGSAKARQASSGDFDHQFPTWSPDSQALYCTALRRSDADELNRSDIWRVDLATGETALVWENAGPVYGLKVAPEGRHLLFGGHENADATAAYSTTPELLILPLGNDGLAAGVAVSLTRKLDRPIGPAGTSDVRAMPAFASGEWAADGKGVYFLLGDRGDSNLWYAAIGGGEPIQLTRYVDRTVADFSVAADGKVALIIGDGVNPDDVFLLAKGDERRLTDHNPIARELALVVPERFTYEGAGGRQMDGWLMRPADYEPGRRYPTVLSIHGGPHGAYGSGLMIYFQTLASAGFAVIYTNPRGSQTYGQQFALDVVGDWGGQDYSDIMNGVDAAVATGVVDPDRLGVMGWSYGGFMTSWTVTQTNRFKAAITGAPVVNRYNFIGTTDIPWFMEHQSGGNNPWDEDGGARLLERSPIRYANRVTTPTMVVCGEGDLRCPIEQAEQFYIALKRIGKAPTVHIRYPGEFHGVARPEHKLDRYERTVAWFRHYLTK